MHTDAGKWRHSGAFPPLFFQKGGQRGAELPFHHRCRSRHIFGGAIFCPHFPKLARKVICATFTCNCSPTKIMKAFFWCDLQKRSSCGFCKPWAPFFEIKQRWVPFSPGFSGILPRFGTNQTFWGCACIPTSDTTAFHNNVIGNFVIYQDRLETNLL